MKNYPVSFIMPYRKTTEDRERNLKLILEWLEESFPSYEIIIVELDEVAKINKSLLTENTKHIFCKWEGLFNRSLARNIGALNAKHNILAFSDNDVIMNPKEFSECVTLCQEKYQAVNPYFVCIDLTEEELESMESKADLYEPSKSPKAQELDSHREDLNCAGGNLLMRRDAFFYIGGWPEEMKGWGAEEENKKYVNYKLPKPRKIDTLEAARREDDSIVAYPLILD